MSQSGSLNNLTPPPGSTLFLEADINGPVSPNGAGIIFVLGGTNISTVGSPGTNTITINAGEAPFDVTTIDDNPTLIASVTVPAGTCANITCTFVALQADFSTTIGGTGFIVARNAGAGAVLAGGGGGHQNIIDDSGGFPEISFGIVGNDVDIFVTGVAATTYNWRMLVSTLEL